MKLSLNLAKPDLWQDAAPSRKHLKHLEVTMMSDVIKTREEKVREKRVGRFTIHFILLHVRACIAMFLK